LVDYFAVIHKYIPPNSLTYRFYAPHVSMVTAKSLHAARKLGLSPERQRFIEEAAMLHDIGIVRVNASEIGCYGELPYIRHGVEGRSILEAEGLPHHALVAERHTGVGITKAEIVTNNFPIPARDMLAESLEEKIISWADLFYGKKNVWVEKPPNKIRTNLSKFKFGEEKIAIFDEWMELFG